MRSLTLPFPSTPVSLSSRSTTRKIRESTLSLYKDIFYNKRKQIDPKIMQEATVELKKSIQKKWEEFHSSLESILQRIDGALDVDGTNTIPLERLNEMASRAKQLYDWEENLKSFRQQKKNFLGDTCQEVRDSLIRKYGQTDEGWEHLSSAYRHLDTEVQSIEDEIGDFLKRMTRSLINHREDLLRSIHRLAYEMEASDEQLEQEDQSFFLNEIKKQLENFQDFSASLTKEWDEVFNDHIQRLDTIISNIHEDMK